QKENALKVFTIDNENNITVYSSRKLAADSGDAVFATQAELSRMTGSWPAARFIELWNSLTGVVPVKRFTDRKTAVTRIWKAIQSISRRRSLGAGSEASAGDRRRCRPANGCSA